jgi:succinylglutamate desuccinylase
MHPGFTNFQKVKKGELLAHDNKGEIICPHVGLILMPLYQKQGEDGFFLIREGI